MKSITLLSLFAAAMALPNEQLVLQPPSVIADVAHSALDWITGMENKVEQAFTSGVRQFESVTTQGIDCKFITTRGNYDSNSLDTGEDVVAEL